MTLREQGSACLSDFLKKKKQQNEGSSGLQWPYFASEMLLRGCSAQLKVLTNVFCLKYCTEVMLYMCKYIVL